MMQKRTTEFKLPQIKRTEKQPRKAMSKTATEASHTLKTRPASGTKVQDLEKKLFSQLDSYQGPSKKNIAKRTGRSSKQIQLQCSTGTQSTPEGYQKMQKFMPGLYSKLIEVKKENFFPKDLAKVQTKVQRQQPLQKARKKEEHADKKQNQQKSPFVTDSILQEGKEGSKQEGVQLSKQQIDSLFVEYIKNEGLEGEVPTSSRQMEELGQSILVCERQISKIKMSMENLVQQLGIECIALDEEEQDDI